RVVGERLRQRRHLAELHQLLDDLGDRDVEVLRDVLDGRAGGDSDVVGALGDSRLQRRRLLVGAAATPAAALPPRGLVRRTAAAGGPARGLRVDHDGATPAAGRAGAAAERVARRPLSGLLVAARGTRGRVAGTRATARAVAGATAAGTARAALTAAGTALT